MNTVLTEDTKAIILLCGVFGKGASEKPLSQTEYTALVRWLIGEKLRPSSLLQKNYIAEASLGSGIDKNRMDYLLGRGVQLGFAVEEWQRNGIWIISRSDKDYSARYKKHLKDKAPPLLFGVGDRSLLKGGGIGIVGSRNVDGNGESFTREVANVCAYNGVPVVSGGARGVDQVAMTAAQESGGITIGILADNLLKKSLERDARKAISNGNLLLISPYHPKARFTVGTAMARNKLIYAMADYALVVSAEYKKGGTWAGAEEELKREFSIPTFVRVDSGVPMGNNRLVDIGAIPWPKQIDRNCFNKQLSDLVTQKGENNIQKSPSLFSFQGVDQVKEQPSISKPTHDENPVIETKSKSLKESGKSIYQVVLPVILNNLDEPKSIKELAEILDINKAQLNEWLKKAVDNNLLIKLAKPVRYKKKE